MNKGELLGFSRWTLSVPSLFRERQMEAVVQDFDRGLQGLTDDHRLVHRLVVLWLIKTKRPVEVIEAAEKMKLTIDHTAEIIGELDRNTGLLRRNADGAVTGAYPVTLDKERGRLVLSTGDEVGADSILDALATLTWFDRSGGTAHGHYTTLCQHCRRTLHIIVKSGQPVKTVEEDTGVRILIPMMPRETGVEGILFCLKNAAVFCTDEHVREHRTRTGGMKGYYLTLDQSRDFMQRVMEKLGIPPAADSV
jgi:hypothetical protein